MNYVSFSDINLKVNDQIIYCDKAELSNSLGVVASFKTDSKVPNNFLSSSSHEGRLSISYLLTGQDPIYHYVYNADSPIALDLGGLTINSGFLSSYSFSNEPYSILRISANIEYFEKPKGHVNRVPEKIKAKKLLSVDDIVIDETVRLLPKDLLSIGYNYSTSIVPAYEVEEAGTELSLKRTVATNKTIKVSFTTYERKLETELSLPLNEARISFGDQKYIISGPLISDDTEVSAEDMLINRYQISQGVLQFKPKIDSFSASAGARESTFTVNGKNLNNITAVFLHEYICDVTPVDEFSFIVTVPEETYVGLKAPIQLSTLGGYVVSTQVFEVT